MKKLILLAIAALFSIAVNAQSKFELMPTGGFVNEENKDNDYVTFDFEGSTKEQIYSRALVAISSMYVSPKDVLSTVENEIISINGVGKEAILGRIMGMKFGYNISYTMTLKFKDGKLRIDAPSINSITHPNPSADRPVIYVPQNIFNKKGEVKNEETKASIEGFFNSLINQITSAMTTATDSNW